MNLRFWSDVTSTDYVAAFANRRRTFGFDIGSSCSSAVIPAGIVTSSRISPPSRRHAHCIKQRGCFAAEIHGQ